MAQTLTALAAVSSPVVPKDSKTLCANMAALGNLSMLQLKAITILSLAYQLNHAGGTDYRAAAGLKQLEIDSQCLLGALPLIDSPENYQNALLQTVLEWNSGHAMDGTLTTDVATLLTQVLKVDQGPPDKLNREVYFLRYLLSRYTTLS